VTLRAATKALLLLALALPVVMAVLVWVGGLLRAMGDPGGAAAVGYVGVACQAVWAISLVGLVIVLALTTVEEGQESRVKSQEPEDGRASRVESQEPEEN
jgi:hypothetical protein